ncbi:ArsR/SmtB family transcription factor [Microlunatus sp. GCM10028923]|uniref:ArsR/SmtB family transcription factor n=1 Tax=Microlunatus sp. GCM10028923 TaxID=3273400 RepID=UPI00361B27F5
MTALATVARLIGDPTRAAMLDALLGGVALASGELARITGVGPATASEHLARLRDGGLVDVVSQGRHRYYRLASPEVGDAIEALTLLDRSRADIDSLRAAKEDAALRLARTCYDHLAGRLGVAVHDALVARGTFAAGYELSGGGAELLGGLGVDVAAARSARRQFARGCLDFTQRRPHLAGALGAALCGRLFELGWLRRRTARGRTLRITEDGRTVLATAFGIAEL